jgi:competence protein ComEA
VRGERERVADRVRALLGVPAPDEDGRHRFRWEPSRRSIAALGSVALVVLVATLWWLRSSHPASVPISAASAGAAGLVLSASATAHTSSPSVVTSSRPPATIVVDVAGKVVRPGIYRLPADSRVFDAVRAAGGARAGVDTVSINLAAPLQDGEQIVVGVSGIPPPGGAGPTSAASTAPAVVDLNAATLDQLETLPGVGPVLGQRILDWRTEHGGFASVDQLNEVSGIGEVTFAELRELVTI